ncbi:MAG: hypothetical protein KGH49_03670 [Candidatus Micrarchaeota archaeon]|nr:hypothetical protein [Candidatus Micrarchaeota archaeon]
MVAKITNSDFTPQTITKFRELANKYLHGDKSTILQIKTLIPDKDKQEFLVLHYSDFEHDGKIAFLSELRK